PVFVAVTVAPGRTAPVLSVTMPSTRAAAVCAPAGKAHKTSTTRTRNGLARNELVMVFPPLAVREEVYRHPREGTPAAETAAFRHRTRQTALPCAGSVMRHVPPPAALAPLSA